MSITKEQRTEAFRQKNLRRRTAGQEQGRHPHARTLRRLGVSKQVKTTVPMDIGDDIVTKEEIQGVAGAFGWGTNAEWNERVKGTMGVER